MSKKQKSYQTPTKSGLYATADFVQIYHHNGVRYVVACLAGDEFIAPAVWVRDGLAFITPDDKRILLPLKEV